MKTLILVRHAKSSWDDPSLNDFERPLNGRGKRDAPMMADRIFDKGVKLDYIVSSPAKRAKKTAEEFARRFSKKGKKLAFKSELYMAGENTFTNVIEGPSVIRSTWDRRLRATCGSSASRRMCRMLSSSMPSSARRYSSSDGVSISQTCTSLAAIMDRENWRIRCRM